MERSLVPMPLVGASYREHARAAAPVEAPARPPSRVGWPSRRLRMLVVAVLLVAGLMVVEWYSELEYSLGVFYVFPIMCAGTVLGRREMVVAACVCALLRGQFTSVPTPVEFWLRFLMAALAYGGIGLLVVEMTQRRDRVIEAYERLRIEQVMRGRAEDSLRLLAESSPAAIVTLDAAGEVLSANRAAAEMLGVASTLDLDGAAIQRQVPVLASVLRRSPDGRPMRAHTTSWARRANGQLFPITVWFSTYGDGPARCLAGIFVDTSEEVRDREREAFRHFVDYNRLLAGAVTHEIRNLCSAVGVVTSNLARNAAVADDVDFRALTHLVEGLSRIAAFELRQAAAPPATPTDLHQVLDQLRVVIEPDWLDDEGTVTWRLEDQTFRVPADAHALLQVFLNLTQNALRASLGHGTPSLDICARREGDVVVVSVTDEGPGVRDTSLLFQPFRPDADGTGLGLFISRAIVRSYGGDLRYVPVERGCRFDVELPCEPATVVAA